MAVRGETLKAPGNYKANFPSWSGFCKLDRIARHWIKNPDHCACHCCLQGKQRLPKRCEISTSGSPQGWSFFFFFSPVGQISRNMPCASYRNSWWFYFSPNIFYIFRWHMLLLLLVRAFSQSLFKVKFPSLNTNSYFCWKSVLRSF